ncbi:LAMI_0A02498g1_1 [Lachancea mirantina]|uniref:LAMI_0A02498g1_1 n=1 Tax=Lachancea mirantina TaxID=1230905 RepID=A0A1G4IN33_9SACH|nr:LAMI_0A02498g1_1 [Lachancea mirantina]
MGKSKRKSKASSKRLQTAGKAGGLGPNRESGNLRKIQPLLKQLESAVANERAMALGTISVLCDDQHMRQMFLRERLIQTVLSRLLTDENTEIVVESYGLLRNLAIEEGYDVCIHLWRSDVWTSLSAGLDKFMSSLASLETGQTQNQDPKSVHAQTQSARLLFDFGENLFSLTVALANGSEDIRAALMEEKIKKVLQCVTVTLTYGMVPQEELRVGLRITLSLFNAILDLIYDLSSQSGDFIEMILGDSYLSEFIKSLPSLLFTNANELTNVLIQGIHLQLLEENATDEQANMIISKVCASIEHIDLPNMVSDMSSVDQDKDLANAGNESVATKIKAQTNVRAAAAVRFQSIEYSLDIITAAMEIVAAQFEASDLPVCNSLQTTLTTLLPKLFQTLYAQFTSRVLIGWNNLLWLFLTLHINVFDLQNEPWRGLWAALPTTSTSSDDDLFSIRVGRIGVTWALLKTAHSQQDASACLAILGCATSEFVAGVISEYNNTESLDISDVEHLRQKCVGLLGVLSLFQGQVELNRQIGHFFMEQLVSNDNGAPVLLDLMDAFIDTYSDANFDYNEPVFVQDRFLCHLKEKVMPNLRNCFKFVDKNKNPELKARVQDAYNVMESFVRYKEIESS